MDGIEYCGKQSTCVNNDDDTRGLTCECSSGYTAHRIFLGKEKSLIVLASFVAYKQGAEIWMNARREEQRVRQTLIASTPMAAITVSVKLALKEIHVRLLEEHK